MKIACCTLVSYFLNYGGTVYIRRIHKRLKLRRPRKLLDVNQHRPSTYKYNPRILAHTYSCFLRLEAYRNGSQPRRDRLRASCRLFYKLQTSALLSSMRFQILLTANFYREMVLRDAVGVVGMIRMIFLVMV